MKNKEHSELVSFKNLVELKYRLYNGILLDVPIKGLNKTKESLLFLLQNRSREQLYQDKKSPLEIIESFFQDFQSEFSDQNEKQDFLFKILQLIERQVVLFDALEDSAFEKINNFSNTGSINYLKNQIFANKADVSLQKIYINQLEEYKIRIVLTAHPTQFYTDQVLGILFDLQKSINKISIDKINEIKDILLQLGYTKFAQEEKPSPLEEAKSITWYLKHVFYETMPKVQKKIHEFYMQVSQTEEIPDFISLELGFWPGGDRDGNPFVTTDITFKVIENLRITILELYLQDLLKLQRRFTFPLLIGFFERVYLKLESTLRSRQVLNSSNLCYSRPEELLKDLFQARKILIREYGSLFIDQLDDLICKVKIFGFYFASLDFRQDSSIHSSLTEKILEKESYARLSRVEKTSFIKEKLLSKQENLEDFKLDCLELEEKDLVSSIKLIEEIHQSFEKKSLHRYIVSNTKDSLNLLELFFLFKTFSKTEISSLGLDIVPLFETIEDLENSQRSVSDLFQNSFYRGYLKTRKNIQTVMLGFSDGTKDGGYVAANWNIFKAKKKLAKVSQDNQIKIIFFDGRGGPPARGGGDTYNFYSSMGEDLKQEEIHLTIQGQTISSNYGTEKSAAFNFEQLFTAGIERRFLKSKVSSFTQEQAVLFEELSKLSQKKYRDLKTHKLFIEYLEKATPLNYYSLLKIGSRPTKRKQRQNFNFHNLRAIPFVCSWTQMKQNILGFYGLGTALENLIKEKSLKSLVDLHKKSPFFQALVENSMQSICKSDLSFSAYLQKTKFREIWNLIHQELELTKKLLLQITQQKELLVNKVVGKKSILLREKIVFLAGIIEHFAIQKIAEKKYSNKAEKEVLEKIILKSMAILVNASRNSV